MAPCEFAVSQELRHVEVIAPGKTRFPKVPDSFGKTLTGRRERICGACISLLAHSQRLAEVAEQGVARRADKSLDLTCLLDALGFDEQHTGEGCRENLVQENPSLTWAAHLLLSEADLVQLLCRKGLPPPRASWAPLYLAVEPSQTFRLGRLNRPDSFRCAR